MDSGYERILFAARNGMGTRTPSAKAYGGGR